MWLWAISSFNLRTINRPWPRPFQGQFVIGRLEHAMVNLPTKFEVSTFSRYGDMKCVKMHKMGWFGMARGHHRSSAMSPFDRARMISYSSVIETMRLSCTVFENRDHIWPIKWHKSQWPWMTLKVTLAIWPILTWEIWHVLSSICVLELDSIHVTYDLEWSWTSLISFRAFPKCKWFASV